MIRRRPLAVAIAVLLVGSAVWACVGDDPVVGGTGTDAGGTSDGSVAADVATDSSSTDSSVDADAGADVQSAPRSCAGFADARACEDFEGTGLAKGFAPPTQDRVQKTDISPGANGSLRAIALTPVAGGSGASFYQLGADIGASFVVHLDVRPSGANPTMGTTLIDWTDVALLTATTSSGKLVLNLQFAGPNVLDGGRFVGPAAEVATLSNDVWSTVDVTFTPTEIRVRVGPLEKAVIKPTEIAIGTAPRRLWIGPYAPAAIPFDLAIDNVIVE